MKKCSIIAIVVVGVMATATTPELSNKLFSQSVTVVAVSKEYQNALETAKNGERRQYVKKSIL
ncbi:hypothetical protein HMPREF1231_0387 [Streptococcus pyogenes GA06023]|nr:hypothetical protein HMPREF1231_0387 [Streptococcus pyogenes GA06023]